MNQAGAQKTVVVGMSGGVDSSVAALLLKRAGYRVIGLFMKNWEEDGADGQCTAAADYDDVARVCARLDIPYYSVNFAREYRDQVFASFLADFRAGLTPNPDVLCNREIKFKAFFDRAMEMGADFVATGHYCRVGRDPITGRATLLKGLDPAKDQSYFLNAVPSPALERTLFPIGGIEKSEVRRLAEEAGLSTHAKKDSTGICFIGERDFTAFLSRYLPGKPGDFRLLNGQKVGRHRGSAFYTLGQRRGLGLGGEGERWFVVSKDQERNIVYVERGETHPALFAPALEARDAAWVDGRPPAGLVGRKIHAKIRYRQADQECVIQELEENGRLSVSFTEPQRAITPGQYVVFYDGEACLGGAVIQKACQTGHSQAALGA